MSLVFRYENTPTTIASIGSNVVRFGTVQIAQGAAQGEPLLSEISWDDPDGTWDVVGYRQFSFTETAAASNSQLIGKGRLMGRRYHRATSFRTTTARHISVEFADQNVLLGWRIMKDANAKRPAETAGDRIRWLLNTRRCPVWAHPTYFANPSTAMDATDYRNQRYNDVLADIANVTGYNFWCDFDEGRERPEVYFIDPNGSDYASTIRISNLLGEIDGDHDNTGLVFAPNEDAELFVDPSRVTASVLVAYDGGDVYMTRDSTGDEFAYVDQSAPTTTIKTETKARALGTRYLDDNDEEDERVSCSIVVPASQVNDLRQGMLTYARFTHFPGWEDFRPCRVIKRIVVQDAAIGQNAYRIELDLSPTTSPGTETVFESVTLHGCNGVMEPGNERSVIVDSVDMPFTAGQVWRYTITNPTHDAAAVTAALRLNVRTAGPVIRSWGGAFGYSDPNGVANGVAGSGPDYTTPDQGFPTVVAMPTQSGTFTVTSTATDNFRLHCTAGYYGFPGLPIIDECWTAVLERIS